MTIMVSLITFFIRHVHVSHVREVTCRSCLHVLCLSQGVNVHMAGWTEQEGYEASSHWQ